MIKFKRTRVVAIILFITLYIAWIATNKVAASTLNGSIQFDDGKPAKNFLVLIVPLSQFASGQMRTNADEAGNFGVANVKSGMYAVYPFDESTEFPLRNDMFLSKNPDRVTVTEKEDTTVKLVLPKPASVISGVISGPAGPLPNLKIILCHTDETWRSATISTDGEGRFTYNVPSGERLSITLPETSRGSLTLSGLFLKPDETREAQIDMDGLRRTEQGTACKPFEP